MQSEEARASLDEWVAPPPPPVDSGFVIENEAGADWAIRKIAQKRRQMAAHQELHDQEAARLNSWLAEVNGPLESDTASLEAALSDYHRRVLADDEKRKTIKLPGGTLKSKKTPDKVEVDPDEFLPWAKKEHPELVRTKEEPNKVELKKLLVPDAPDGKAVDQTTGEIIPGVAIERGEVRYTVEVSE